MYISQCTWVFEIIKLCSSDILNTGPKKKWKCHYTCMIFNDFINATQLLEEVIQKWMLFSGDDK